MGIFKKFVSILKYERYIKNNDCEKLPEEKLRALLVGEMSSERLMYYCNSLTCSNDIKKVAENLFEEFEVNSKMSAQKVIEWFLNRGHRAVFEHLKDKNIEIDDFERSVATLFDVNINASLNTLVKYRYVKNKEDVFKINITAWDMSRLVVIARSCFDCGFINEDEAWEIIDESYKKVCASFSSWEEFAESFVIGRALAHGDDSVLLDVIQTANGLLNDEESPWILTKLL